MAQIIPFGKAKQPHPSDKCPHTRALLAALATNVDRHLEQQGHTAFNLCQAEMLGAIFDALQKDNWGQNAQ